MQRRSRVLLSPGSHSLSASSVSSRAHGSHDATLACHIPAHDKSFHHHEVIVRPHAAVVPPTSLRTKIWVPSTPVLFSSSRPQAHVYIWARSSPICFDGTRSYANQVPRLRGTSDRSGARGHALTKQPQGRVGAIPGDPFNHFTDKPTKATPSRSSTEELKDEIKAQQTQINNLNGEIHRLNGVVDGLKDHNARLKRRDEQVDIEVRQKVDEKTKNVQADEAKKVAEKVSALESRTKEAEEIAALSQKESDEARRTYEEKADAQERHSRTERQMQEAKHRTTLNDLEAKRKALEDERIDQQTKIANEEAAVRKELEIRRSNRATYRAYHDLYDKTNQQAELFLKYWFKTADTHDDREQYWIQATRDFDRFRVEQSATWDDRRYGVYIDRIHQFVKDNSSRMTHIEGNLQQSELGNLIARAKMEGHESRINTRLLRYSNVLGTNIPVLTELLREGITTMMTHPVRLSLNRLELSLQRGDRTFKPDMEDNLHRRKLKSTLEDLQEVGNHHVSHRTSSLPDVFKVIALDLGEVYGLRAKTIPAFREAMDALRRVAGASIASENQLSPIYDLRQRMRDATHEILENTTVLRIAQDNLNMLPQDDVENARRAFSGTRGTVLGGRRQRIARRPARFENPVLDEDENVQTRIDEVVSILDTAKKLAQAQLVTEDAALSSRMSKFIKRFATSSSQKIQSAVIKWFGRESLKDALDLALDTKDPTKFGPSRSRLNTDLKRINLKYTELERSAEGAQTEAKKSMPTKARKLRSRQASSPKVRAVPS